MLPQRLLNNDPTSAEGHLRELLVTCQHRYCRSCSVGPSIEKQYLKQVPVEIVAESNTLSAQFHSCLSSRGLER